MWRYEHLSTYVDGPQQVPLLPKHIEKLCPVEDDDKLVLLDAGLLVQLHSVFFIAKISFWRSLSSREILLAASFFMGVLLSFPTHTLIILLDGIYRLMIMMMIMRKGEDRNINPKGCPYNPLSYWNSNIKQIYVRAFGSKCCGINGTEGALKRVQNMLDCLFYFTHLTHLLTDCTPFTHSYQQYHVTHEEPATALLLLGIKGPAYTYYSTSQLKGLAWITKSQTILSLV